MSNDDFKQKGYHSKSEMRRKEVQGKPSAPREWWMVLTAFSAGYDGSEAVIYDEFPIHLSADRPIKVVEHSALLDARQEIERQVSTSQNLTKQLREYEHECETINEMRAKCTALEGELKFAQEVGNQYGATIARLEGELALAFLEVNSVHEKLAECKRWALEEIRDANGSPEDEDFITTTARETLTKLQSHGKEGKK